MTGGINGNAASARVLAAGVILGYLASELARTDDLSDLELVAAVIALVVVLLLIAPDFVTAWRRLRGKD